MIVRKALLKLTVLVFLTNCSNTGSNKSNSVVNNAVESTIMQGSTAPDRNKEFSRYLCEINTLDLPYETSCNTFNPVTPEYDSALVSKFAGSYTEIPFRRIHTNHSYEIIINFIIADNYVPIVKTYGETGKIISSRRFFNGYCGEDPGYLHYESIRIAPDLTITQTDSTWTWQIDSLDNELPGTKKFEVITTHYCIDNSGEILKR